MEMNIEKYKEWLRSMKVGDKVAVKHNRPGGSLEIDITEVTNITPKGGVRIAFNKECLFRDGVYSHGGGYFEHIYQLEPITDSLTAQIKRMAQQKQIENFHGWSKLDNEAINSIHSLIIKN
jgi:hypothetical protein